MGKRMADGDGRGDRSDLWLVSGALATALLCGCGPRPVARDVAPRLVEGTAVPGRWTVIDAETIAFAGAISPATWPQYQAVATRGLRRVIVNSGGGDVAAAIRIADDFRVRGIELVVDGYCLSSCANYWALAAPRVRLSDGVVGFHGNLSGCVDVHGGLHRYVMKDLPRDASPERIADVTAQVEAALRLEAGFFGQNGVAAAPPTAYCRDDKGLVPGRVFSFIAPRTDHLKALGVRLEAGSRQSAGRMAEFNARFRNPIAGG